MQDLIQKYKKLLSNPTGLLSAATNPTQYIANRVAASEPVRQLTSGLVKGARSVFEPYVRTVGEAGYQATRYATDPLFRKAIANPESLNADEIARVNAPKQTMFLQPEQIGNRMQTIKTGATATGKALAGTYGLGAGLPSLLTTGAIGGTLNSVFAEPGKRLEAFGEGVGQAPLYSGFGKVSQKVTSPLVSKIAASSPFVAGRLGQGVANVGEGIAFDVGTGMPTTPTSVGLSFLTGVAGKPFTGSTKAATSKFRLEETEWDRLIEAETILKNPSKYIDEVLGNFSTPVARDRAMEQAIGAARENIETMAAKRLPDKILNKVAGDTNKTIKALIDLGNKNRLANVPGMGIIGDKANPNKATDSIAGLLKRETEKVESAKMSNYSNAEAASQERSFFSKKTIQDINLLKRVSSSSKFADGDVETYFSKYPKVTESVIEAVRENPKYADLDDSGALQIALNLPTKEMATVRRVDTSELNILKREEKLQNQAWKQEFGRPATEAEQIRQIDQWEKAVQEAASGVRRFGKTVSVEPSFQTKKVIQSRVEAARVKYDAQQYKQWQRQVFGEANTRTETQAIEDLGKIIKKSTDAGVIDRADTWKDKPRLFLSRETMERNFEDIMGKDARAMKQTFLEPIYKANAAIAKFKNTERASIKSLGIAPRSEESRLLQEFGEGIIKAAQLPTESASKIIKAEKVIRQKYDTYLNVLNKVLTRNGYDPVPKRKDYFHHFQDLNGMFEQVGVAIKATDLPTDINGLTADFKPGRSFFAATLRRNTDVTSVDAITGIDKYLDGLASQVFHTDNIKRLRTLETAIREKYTGTNHLTNFVADLAEYTNTLAGKKSMVDRAAEALVGRKIYAALDLVKRQTGANMVGANVSSAVTNFIPVTQTLATTSKKAIGQAMLSIMKNIYKDDGFVDGSNFLTSRIGSDRLAQTKWEKIGSMGGWMFKTFDSFVSQVVVRSKYLESLNNKKTPEQALQIADSWARKTMAGRSAGEMPTLFNSKTLGFFTQFQLEVNNQVSFIAKDIPRNFDTKGAASALAQLAVYSYMFNTVYEKAFGRRPAFDPIGVAQQAYEDYTNPDMKEGQATKNLVTNVASNLPFTSTFTGGRIPVGASIPDPFAVVSGESTIGKELQKPLFYLLPPTGGGQLKKTLTGIDAFNKGYSESDSGRVRYPIPQTPVNAVRTAVAGQYSTPEAREYFREGKSVLGENQTKMLKAGSSKKDIYSQIEYNRQLANELGVETPTVEGASVEALNEQTARLEVRKSQSPQVVNNKLIYWDAENDEVKSIKDYNKKIIYKNSDGDIKAVEKTVDLKPPTLSSSDMLNTELFSDYSSKITARRNSIVDLASAGAISVSAAEKQLVKLDAAQKLVKEIIKGIKTKTTAKAGKKLTAAKIKTLTRKVKKVSIPKVQSVSRLTISPKRVSISVPKKK